MINLSREKTQLISAFTMSIGMFLMFSNSNPLYGVCFIGCACWILMISESILHAKIQFDMFSTLENLRKRQEKEIQDLLFFLRQLKLAHSPWSSIEAAKNYISNLGLPAIITDSGGTCISLNEAFTASLGYDKDLIGSLCHNLHMPDSYGEYVQGIQKKLIEGKKFMHSRQTFIDSSGNEQSGTVSIIFLSDERTAIGIWHPDADGILKLD